MKVVMFVRNAVTHDARVLREAATLAAAGHDVTIVGRGEGAEEAPVTLEVHGTIRILRVPGPAAPLRRWRLLRRRPWGLRTELGATAREALRARPPRVDRLLMAVGRGLALLPWIAMRGVVRLAHGVRPDPPADALDWLATWRFAVGAWADRAAVAVPHADAWHGHDLSGVLAAERARRRAGGVLVFDAHELLLESRTTASRPRWARAVLARRERAAYRAADALVTVNPAIAGELSRRYGPKARTAVVHNAPGRWARSPGAGHPLRGAIGIGPDVPLVLYHGGFSAERGLEELAAAARLPALDGVHVAFLGYGALEDELRRLAADPASGGRIHVVPAVPPEALLDWVADADVGVMPIRPTTLNHRLSTPNKLFECLAAGVPVVASDMPGMRPIVRDDPLGAVGELCDPDDPASIAAAVARLLAAPPEARAALRDRCRAVARERWNWETESTRLVELYADLEAAHRGRPAAAAVEVPTATATPRGAGPPAPDPGRPLRVLTVARWYPSHDSPGRGSFVADLVGAVAAAGADARVVSFDTVLVRGTPDRRDRVRRATRAAFDAVVTPDALFTEAGSWGASGVPVARLPVVRRPGGDAGAVVDDHIEALRPFVRRLVRDWRPDVIHAHVGLPDGVAAAKVGGELGIPVVVTEHASTLDAELASPVARERYRTLLVPGIQMLAVSPAVGRRVADLMGVPADRLGLLPDPVPDARFHADPDAAREPDELLWVGNLGAHKGTDMLLRAFALARAQRPALRLRVIGGEHRPGNLARLAALAASLGVGGAVRFDGWLPRPAVADAMARASAFVHASPYETFGVVAAEAILAGLPVTCLPHAGGVPWIVGLSGGYGAIAAADDEASLAGAIVAALDGPLPVDAPSARARLVEAVGERAVAGAALGVYARAIAEARPAGPAGTSAAGPAGPAGPATPAAIPVPAPPPAQPAIVAGSARDESIRLVAGLPPALQDQIVLVTPWSAGPSTGAPAGPVFRARLVEAGAGTSRPRAGDPLVSAIRVALEVAPGQAGAPGGPRLVVALDTAAAGAVAALAGEGVRLAPGVLRWLADRWDADATGAEGPDARPSVLDPGAPETA